MSTKYLGLGMNAYPGNELNGCINDVKDSAGWAKAYRAFDSSSQRMHLRFDNDCRTKDWFDGLKWLKDGAKPGDLLFFHNSGHGATNVDNKGVLHDVVCPIDFDWSWEHMITNDQFKIIFGDIPDGVILAWLSDSCHSGDLVRGLGNPHRGKSRVILPEPHSVLADRIRVAKRNGAEHKLIGHELPNVQFIGGCRSDELSADTEVNGRPGGACTQYLLPQLRVWTGKKYSHQKIVNDLNTVLDSMNYGQHPVAGGAKSSNVFLSAAKGTNVTVPGTQPIMMDGLPPGARGEETETKLNG